MQKKKGGRPRKKSAQWVYETWTYAKRCEPDLSKQKFAEQIGYANGCAIRRILAEHENSRRSEDRDDGDDENFRTAWC